MINPRSRRVFNLIISLQTQVENHEAFARSHGSGPGFESPYSNPGPQKPARRQPDLRMPITALPPTLLSMLKPSGRLLRNTNNRSGPSPSPTALLILQYPVDSCFPSVSSSRSLLVSTV